MENIGKLSKPVSIHVISVKLSAKSILLWEIHSQSHGYYRQSYAPITAEVCS